MHCFLILTFEFYAGWLASATISSSIFVVSDFGRSMG